MSEQSPRLWVEKGWLTEVVGVVAHNIVEVGRGRSLEVHRQQVTQHDSALENERGNERVLHGC